MTLMNLRFVMPLLLLLLWAIPPAQAQEANVVEITSLQELEKYAGLSGNHVKMAPGVYQLAELMTPEVIAQRTQDAIARKERGVGGGQIAYMLGFTGSNNTFDLTGVTIEVDTKLLSKFKGCRINEIQIDGKRIDLLGLTIRDIGNHPTARGGTTMTVNGDGVNLTDVTLHVSGSFPYGYGDLLGKGSKAIVRGRKHSGLLLSGSDIKLTRCKLYTKAFGHAFFVQGGRDITFEDCYAEGEIRPTDDMLAETSGPAFKNGFKTVYKPNVIQPGYMKSLNECGFRTYGKGGPKQRETGKVTLINCTAKNMRVGFAFAAQVPSSKTRIVNCEAINCERGYYLRRTVVENSRGDAKYGSLLYLVGNRSERSKVDLTLTPGTSDINVHAVALISGEGHEVTLKAEQLRGQQHPIMIGYTPPGGGENSAPIGEGPAVGIRLNNTTGMPIVFGAKAQKNAVTTNGEVSKDLGKSNRVTQTDVEVPAASPTPAEAPSASDAEPS